MTPRIFSSALRTDSKRRDSVQESTEEQDAGRTPLGLAAVGLVVVAGVALRFIARSPLWLDEALSVSIARLPIGEIPEALRQDGSPPLYYLVLKGWLGLPGVSDEGSRLLSGLFAVLALPVMAAVGRRFRGPHTGRAALLLLASSPFAIRYATEARMYSLLVLLALVAGLLILKVLEGGRTWEVVALALSVAALMLTHYWAIYPLAVVAGWMGLRWMKGQSRAGIALVGLAAGVLVTLPWWPVAVFQLRHTGTPWASYLTVSRAFGSLRDLAGGRPEAAALLEILFLLLAFVGAFGVRRHLSVELRWPPMGPGALVSALWVATLLLAGVSGLIFGVGYASRYSSVILPAVLLSVMAGIFVLPNLRLRTAVLSVIVLLGFLAALPNAWTRRTTAGLVASTLNREAKPGDVVVYCPDQLSPAVTRLVKVPLDHITFPPNDDPGRVNWQDYRERVRDAGAPESFARQVVARASKRDVWLVWAPGYRYFVGKCNRMRIELQEQRDGTQTVVHLRRQVLERPSLVHSPS